MSPLPLLATLIACTPLGPIQSTQGDTAAGYNPQHPLLVAPSELDFGDVVVNDHVDGDPPQQTVTVTNLSAETQSVFGYTKVTGDSSTFRVEGASYVELQPGEDVDLLVSFFPLTAEHYSGEFRIEGGTSAVRMAGTGLAPIIDLHSDEPDAVAVGCTADFSATVTNRGTLPLNIEAIGLDDGADYRLLDPPAVPYVLDVGERLELGLRADPVFSWEDDDEREDAVIVRSDDPLSPEARQSFDIQPTYSSEISETRTYYPDTMTDLLIMVDNTGNMASRIGLAEDTLPVLVETLYDANVDVHAAVITGGSACPESGFADSSVLDEDNLLAALVRGLDGPAGPASSTLLSHAESAVEQSVDSGCLEGFLRDGALLHVVVISGQDDASDVSVEELLAALRGAAPQADEVVVSALVSTDPGGCMGLRYGGTYLAAALESGGVQANACAEDWSSAMEELALVSAVRAEGALSMVLSPPANPETIRVTVDGIVHTSWSYAPDTATLSFPDEDAPPAGSTLQLRYLMWAECDD